MEVVDVEAEEDVVLKGVAVVLVEVVKFGLHGLSLYAIVIGMGWLFGWYQELDGFIGVSIVFLLVYGFVWLSSRWMDKQDAKKINQALEAIRDNE